MSAPGATGVIATTQARTCEARATEAAEALAFDPQTAGGLLVAVPADKGAVLAATFADRGLELHRVGRVREGSGVELR